MSEEEFPMGATVTFRDWSSESESIVVREGTVNGKPLMENGELRAVPVWSERDRGQEATTIFVAPTNILSSAEA